MVDFHGIMGVMIPRTHLMEIIRTSLRRNRVVVLAGPRQCGKTTMARQLVNPDSPSYFDLENPVGLARLDEPMTALAPLLGLVVIDEIQRRPELFPILRVLCDRDPPPARFLVLGSASPRLLRQSSESLAGRVETVLMTGFGPDEIGWDQLDCLWLRGGFPLSFLAGSEEDSAAWRRAFVQTFLERDIPQFGFRVPATTMRRFWTMLAHIHGQVWNAAEPARSLGIGQTSVRRYLDLLTDLFMVRQLLPLHANIGKRQVKSPKVYFRDTGLLHHLLGIQSLHDLLCHPKCGASWEGLVIEETLRTVGPDEAFFWATHGGAEIDLVMVKNSRLYGVECKRADAPRMTPSMRHALTDLRLERIAVIYPGSTRYDLADRVHVVPFQQLQYGMAALFPP